MWEYIYIIMYLYSYNTYTSIYRYSVDISISFRSLKTSSLIPNHSLILLFLLSLPSPLSHFLFLYPSPLCPPKSYERKLIRNNNICVLIDYGFIYFFSSEFFLHKNYSHSIQCSELINWSKQALQSYSPYNPNIVSK